MNNNIIETGLNIEPILTNHHDYVYSECFEIRSFRNLRTIKLFSKFYRIDMSCYDKTMTTEYINSSAYGNQIEIYDDYFTILTDKNELITVKDVDFMDYKISGWHEDAGVAFIKDIYKNRKKGQCILLAKENFEGNIGKKDLNTELLYLTNFYKTSKKLKYPDQIYCIDIDENIVMLDEKDIYKRYYILYIKDNKVSYHK